MLEYIYVCLYMYLKMNFIAQLVNVKLQLKIEYLVIIQVL